MNILAGIAHVGFTRIAFLVSVDAVLSDCDAQKTVSIKFLG